MVNGPKCPQSNPHSKLERAFIQEFLERLGYSFESLKALPETEANAILKDAAQYASGRLTEVETRAHLVEDLHHGVPPA